MKKAKMFVLINLFLLPLLRVFSAYAEENNKTIYFNIEYIGPTYSIFTVRNEVIGSDPIPQIPFQFTLKGEGNAPMPALSQGQKITRGITGNGTVDFGEIVFNSSDVGKVYSYTVQETQGAEPNVSYDKRTHKIQVAVTKENNTLIPVLIVDGVKGNREMVFRNKTDGGSTASISSVPFTPADPDEITIYKIFGDKPMPNTGFPTK